MVSLASACELIISSTLPVLHWRTRCLILHHNTLLTGVHSENSISQLYDFLYQLQKLKVKVKKLLHSLHRTISHLSLDSSHTQSDGNLDNRCDG